MNTEHQPFYTVQELRFHHILLLSWENLPESIVRKMNVVMKKLTALVLILMLASLVLANCSIADSLLAEKTTITIYYDPELKDWLEPMVTAFNAGKHETKAGSVVVVEATAMESMEVSRQILDGTLKPTIWVPSSSIVFPNANVVWRETHNEDLVPQADALVYSPFVIAMWEPMAAALGYPEKSIGWNDLAQLTNSANGWDAYGYPEWGDFKFGTPHPQFTIGGMMSLTAQTYAGVLKHNGLTPADTQSYAATKLVGDIQRSVIHYGPSTSYFATLMFENGPSFLSAAVMYEHTVIRHESERMAQTPEQPAVIAIYPEEGAFLANFPFAVLNGGWVNSEQRAAAEVLHEFLMAREQQAHALNAGFRPANGEIPTSAPIDSSHGANPAQPATVFDFPPVDVLSAAEMMWLEVKKPVDVVVVMDVSKAMTADKLASAGNTLNQFTARLNDNDRLSLLAASNTVVAASPLSELGTKRGELTNLISGLQPGGNTSLYDAILTAYALLEQQGNPDHIRAIVVVSMGADTWSDSDFSDVEARVNEHSATGGKPIKLFTVTYSDGADASTFTDRIRIMGGETYLISTDTINRAFSRLLTFF